MPKAFSLVSWNVEHFKGDPNRTKRVIDFLSTKKPDVFALLEVEGKEVFKSMVTQMPKYQFHITEGRQTQEVLVGVKSGFTAFFTQKITFKSGNQYLRPGALLTLTIDGKHYSIVFLHTKSSSKPIGLGIRDDQLNRAFKFKKKLDKIAGGKGKANYIFLGDLNIMGMKYPFQKNIASTIEIQKLDKDVKKIKMRRLNKNALHTWWNGTGSTYPPADLDHVVASDHLVFSPQKGADIEVLGWPAETTKAKQTAWINKYSDHGMLYMVVEKV